MYGTKQFIGDTGDAAGGVESGIVGLWLATRRRSETLSNGRRAGW